MDQHASTVHPDSGSRRHRRDLLQASVWRRISPREVMPVPAAEAASSPVVLPAGEVTPAGTGDARRSRRRRRPQHRRKLVRPDDGSQSDAQENLGNGGNTSPGPRASDDGDLPALVAPCVIDRADRICREEEALRLAVLVTAISEVDSVSIQEVAGLLASKFDLAADSLVLRRVGPLEFLVFMADEESAINLANSNNSPADNGSIRLHCRRWSRFVHATGTALPHLVEIDMHGMPGKFLRRKVYLIRLAG